MINNFETGLSGGYEGRVLPTPEAIDRVLLEMGEPGAFGPAHSFDWIKAIEVAMQGTSLIEIGMSSRHGE